MKYCLVFVMIWSLLLFLLSLLASGIIGYANFYGFTIPFIVASFSSFVLAVCGLWIKAKRKIIFIYSLVLFSSLVVPHSYALLQWPPDDDGAGILWSFVLGGGVLLALIFGFFVLMHFLARKMRTRQL